MTKRITLTELRKLIKKTITEEYLPGCPDCGSESIRDDPGIEELPREDRLLCSICATNKGHWRCPDCGKWNKNLEEKWDAGEEPCVHCGFFANSIEPEKKPEPDRF